MLRSSKILSAALRNGNGGSLLFREGKFSSIIPPCNPCRWTSLRFQDDVYKLAHEAAVKQSRARIKDEMSRSVLTDMNEYVKHRGKVSKANKVIVPAVSALKFPSLEVYFTDGSKLTLPVTSKEDEANLSSSDTAETGSAKASLISLSFRESSRALIDSWTSPFMKAFAHSSDVRLYEVSLMDQWLLSRKLIRKLLLKYMRKPAPAEKQDALLRQIVYSFGDHYYFRKELKIVNLLTGYAFLLDKSGRVRWSGTGAATEEELSSLLRCTSILLEEK
ncbi:mitochondrial ATPase complex subunit ATP10-like [Salvia splendens]|uniref:mitochondrial ATPase complex subunit ATP10-like n=1 Tax=Salvia splendens TaxID=180675 RepID=UPI0011045E35|nr:mitochondrial ATPase complex subunit ATP10-like [Salvia splendens]